MTPDILIVDCPKHGRVGPLGSAVKCGTCVYEDRWQPIETAPQDGTEVLVIATRGSMFKPDPKCHVARYSRGWWSGRDTLSHETHWRPLPEMP